MKMDKSLLKKLVALAGALVFAALAGVDFYDHRHSKETVVASDALTETHMLRIFGRACLRFTYSLMVGSTRARNLLWLLSAMESSR